MDSAVDVHVCNDWRLMTDFIEKPMRVGGSTANGVSPGRGTVWIKLTLEDGYEEIILNLRNVFYWPNSPSSLVSLSLLNDLTYSIIMSATFCTIGQVKDHLLLPSIGNEVFSYIPSISQSQPPTSSKPKTTPTKKSSQRYISYKITIFPSRFGTNVLNISTSQL